MIHVRRTSLLPVRTEVLAMRTLHDESVEIGSVPLQLSRTWTRAHPRVSSDDCGENGSDTHMRSSLLCSRLDALNIAHLHVVQFPILFRLVSAAYRQGRPRRGQVVVFRKFVSVYTTKKKACEVSGRATVICSHSCSGWKPTPSKMTATEKREWCAYKLSIDCVGR